MKQKLDQGGIDGSTVAERAAYWFVHMRGPDGDRDRPAFDAWRQTDPKHQSAYERIARVYDLGAVLQAAPSPRRVAPPHGRWLAGSLAIAALAASLILALDLSGLRNPAASPDGRYNRDSFRYGPILATTKGEVRGFRLRDGTKVTLDAGTVLAIAMTGAQRTLILRAGRARFDVSHDPHRPFVVEAGGGSVTARGTLFDVGFAARGDVVVRLYRGAVDVRAAKSVGSGSYARLRPGDRVDFADAVMAMPRRANEGEDSDWPQALYHYDRVSLGQVIADANRYTRQRIVAEDSRIAALQVSGSFRINDAGLLADDLATIFALRVDRSDPQLIRLRPALPQPTR